MTQPIRLGISTCPNDTFAFHGLLSRSVDWRGLDFQIELLDIQQLNDRLFSQSFDVAKASFHAALHLTDSMVVLPSGSALGFGNGPLLLASRPDLKPLSASSGGADQIVLCPGKYTTAAMLYQLFYPGTAEMRHVVFSDIMPLLQRGHADFGVCIHEGRFTWQNEGLGLVEDLGKRWETETLQPLPLGGLLGRKDLGSEVLRNVQTVIHASLQYALANPDQALPTMRQYAQEFDDDVLRQHVELYVNDWTIELGEIGASALRELSNRARQIGLVPREAPDLSIL